MGVIMYQPLCLASALGMSEAELHLQLSMCPTTCKAYNVVSLTMQCYTGTGKTAIMRDKLKNMDSETMAFSTINMNSFSDAPSLQGTLEQPLEKKSGQSISDFRLSQGA